MKYDNITQATFIKRPNRFIAEVEIEGQRERVHVKNTGRCKELLIPGCEIWLTAPGTPERKTKYDLVTVRKDNGTLFNIDSQAPNKVVKEWLATQDYDRVVPEYTYGDSRAQNPTTDGIISCDRMVAKALYDLGYTGQPTGGITCGNADEYLASWGFERSENLYDAKRGSIMLVKHKDVDYTSHMYVLAIDMDFNAMVADRYDCGSNGNIQSVQPLRGEGFWYRTDSIIVYNIPN